MKQGYYELKHPSRKHWYDLHQTEIDWVDGRKVSFSALHDITDKKIYQRKIEQQAYTDFLTGLYNRMCCERDLAQYIQKAEAEGGKGGLLYLDLDDFKHINDGLGHQYGDVLLKSISHSLQRIPEIHNTCYRMGGDEFVIVVPPESIARFDGIVEEIKEIFSKPWFLKNADYYCTMSMGICYFPEDGSSVQDLIKKADIAMYEAKKSGKNRVAVYSDNISSTSNKRLDMEKNMRDATAGDYKEFEVYYQPIIDIQKEGTPCVGAEALVRWNSATLGFIPPSDFIPLAEYLGLINPIGNHVMKEACKACQYWNTHGHPEFKVNVNLSVVQLLQTDIVETIEETIRRSGINPHNLTLEVTESLAINDMERMKKILNQIRGLGARIALDDFGTGYSSLNHIREIPLDVIKVDQSFVSDLTEDSYSQSFIKMVAEAFVCDLSADEIREYRGTLTEPGKESPYRNRSIEENLELFEGMKNGEYPDGSKVLRAKIDMASPNINMRDPVIYRVARMTHHNTGDKWCIYPMYDFAHPIEDAIEGVSHSICTLEFEDHRPLYDWVVRELEYENPPKQIEFAKLYLTNVITGKRYIKKLVEDGIVDGWDDPRLVSIAALRRRGFTADSIKKFMELVGISKSNSSVDYAMLEYCVRDDLKLKANRYMAVVDPIKLVIDNYPEDQVEMLDSANNQENEAAGVRQIPFSKYLYIERDDFMEEPPKKYFRLFPGNEVRLMNAYFVTCTGCEKDENGNVTTVHCTYDPETKSGSGFNARKVKGTIHWVSAESAIDAEVRLYENIVDEEKGKYVCPICEAEFKTKTIRAGKARRLGTDRICVPDMKG